MSSDSENPAQWAPSLDYGNQWVMIGEVDGNKSTQCLDYGMLNGMDEAPWGSDGSNSELKHHILCCATNKYDISNVEDDGSKMVDKAEVAKKEEISSVIMKLSPIWYSPEEGWAGGSHDQALQFCEMQDKELCPYVACEYFRIACFEL